MYSEKKPLINRAVSALIALVLFFCVAVSSGAFGVYAKPWQQYETYTVKELSGKYKTQGRTQLANDALVLEWSASGVEFNANCSGSVYIDLVANKLTEGSAGGIYFTVVIDGKVQHAEKRIPQDNGDSWVSNSTGYPFHITKKGETRFLIAEGLEYGRHTFAIYNQTEAYNASFGVKAITLKGEMLRAPAEKELYIEFVGDSIAAGYGNLSCGKKNQDLPLYQDATRSWSYYTAKALDADWSVVARSGAVTGRGYGWSGVNSLSMQVVYPLNCYFSAEPKQYEFERKPDIIILSLGTNDLRTYSKYTNISLVEKGFADMLRLLRSSNPEAKIIWAYGMMNKESGELIKRVVASFGGAKKGFYALELPLNTEGGANHPGIAAQAVYAERTVEYIKEILEDK